MTFQFDNMLTENKYAKNWQKPDSVFLCNVVQYQVSLILTLQQDNMFTSNLKTWSEAKEHWRKFWK